MLKKLIIIGVVFVAFESHSQQFEQSSLYMYNAQNYNPAYAGSRNTISASVLAREQWIGLDGAPSTQFFSFNTPLKNQSFAIGTHLVNDRVGARKKTSAYLDAAGSIRLNKNNQRLNVGLSAGIDNYRYGFSDLYAIDPNDPVAALEFAKTNFNVGAGIYWFGERHYLGLSVPTIVEHDESINGIVSNLNKRHYLLTAGVVLPLNSITDFKPSTLLKYVPGGPLVFDLNASFMFYKKYWLGAMYRHDEGVGLNLAIVLKENFTIGYAYDYPINKLRTHQMGSHEIVLQFDFSKYKNQGRTYSPRYF